MMRCLDDTVGFVIPRRSGGYVIGHGRQLRTMDWETGSTQVCVSNNLVLLMSIIKSHN